MSFGADGPAQATIGGVPVIANGFQFAVTSGSTVDFDVKSHGVEVNYVTLSAQTVGLDGESQTLTAYAGQGGPAVFTLTLNGDGSWLFNLLEPLDEASQGRDTTQIDLSNLIKAVDFDGDSVTLSGDFKITVTDDVPVLTAAASGAVFEAGLSSATDPFGTGNHAGSASFATEASGTLGIHFGADGPAQAGTTTSETEGLDTGTQFDALTGSVNFNADPPSGQIGNIVYTFPDGPPGAITSPFGGDPGLIYAQSVVVSDKTGPFMLADVALGADPGSELVLSGLDAQGDVVASATVTVPDDGGASFIFDATGTAFAGTQISQLEIAGTNADTGVVLGDITVDTGASRFSGPLYFTDPILADKNVTVTDAHGHAVSLADLTSHGEAVHFELLGPQTLVAYTGTTAPGAIDAASVVFSVTLSTTAANGTYDFVLDQPLDQPLSGPGWAQPGLSPTCAGLRRRQGVRHLHGDRCRQRASADRCGIGHGVRSRPDRNDRSVRRRQSRGQCGRSDRGERHARHPFRR